jgi:hypothetical protein
VAAGFDLGQNGLLASDAPGLVAGELGPPPAMALHSGGATPRTGHVTAMPQRSVINSRPSSNSACDIASWPFRDLTRCPLFGSLSGVKRTSQFKNGTSVYDPGCVKTSLAI